MFKGTTIQRMRAALTLVVVAGLLAGCQTTGKKGETDALNDLSAPTKPEARFKVAADPTAPFFKYSPQQASGADQQIIKDTRVELLSRLAGYSKIKLPNGNIGFMDSSDLIHLSPKEISDEDAAFAAKQAAAAQALAVTQGANNANIGNGGNYNPPPEAGQSQPLPIADPTPAATPPPSTMFRY